MGKMSKKKISLYIAIVFGVLSFFGLKYTEEEKQKVGRVVEKVLGEVVEEDSDD